MLSIYKASAGSGKTFTLTYEYIKLLLGYKDERSGRFRLDKQERDRHRFILAVTFTNKATDEMKRRIIHELAVLGGMEPGWTGGSPYKDMLMHEFGCSEADLTHMAAVALRRLLFDFNFFQVSTIDSFFQIILRTFAREAELTGNYEVDLDNERAIGYGVRELFDSLKVNGDTPESRRVVDWITDYLLGRLNDGRAVTLFNRSSQMHSEFLRFIGGISNDMFTVHYKEMMDYLACPDRLQRFSAQISQHIDAVLVDTRRLCSCAVDVIRKRGYADGPKLKVTSYLMNQIADIAVSGEEKGSRGSAQAVYDDPSKAYNKKLCQLLADTPDPELEQSIREACAAIVEGKNRLKLLRETRANLFVLGILEKVYHYIGQYRSDNNTILLSDTNSLLRDIIGDDDTPFVYERVGVWLRHFLIDEFQDTSRLQWENLRPLLHEGQASGHDSLIIGDEKQCIYRFRFSDPTLLQHEVQGDFPHDSQVRGADASGNTNWRSSADVVRFNNALFSRLSAAAGFDDIYANVCQQVPDKHMAHRGYVEVNDIQVSDTARFEEAALRHMVCTVKRQLASGYRPCDIVVLTRFNREASKAIEYLMHSIATDDALTDVRVISDDAMFVSSAPSVRLIISVLRFLSTPYAAESADDGCHRKRLRELGEMINRYEYVMSHSQEPSAALREALVSTTGMYVPSDDIGAMTCFNLPSMVERIIHRYISPSVAQSQNMYLSAFQDAVAEFCSYGPCDVQSFLKWWDESGRRSKISAPFDERALRVMTIHKSKGLEFKCVHMPLVNWNMVDFKGYEWFVVGDMPGIASELVPPMLPYRPGGYMDGTQFEEQYRRRRNEQLLDELNVLYVAFTRAVDELVVSYMLAKASESVPVSCLLDEALSSVDGCESSTGCVDTGDGAEVEILSYRFGSPTSAGLSDGHKRTALDAVEVVDMPGYCALDRDDLWQNTRVDNLADFSVARERGIVLHDVLARVRRASHLSRAVKKCVRAGLLPESESREVEMFIARELRRPDVAPWFDGFSRVLCERPLVLPDGTTCRPDRVVWTSDGHVDVIDYKFGAERPKAYASQVRGYMQALAGMGVSGLRGFIWYVDSGVIREVD